MQVSKRAYQPVPAAEKATVYNKIQTSAANFPLAKCKLNFSITTNLDGDKKNYNARAVCLWQPGKKIRMRISHILAGTIADILFDGEKWYITDEQNARVFITKQIDVIRVAGFPKSFFEQMQRLPKTWLPKLDKKIKIGKNENSYKITIEKTDESFEWIFPEKSPLPAEIKLTTKNNGCIIAAFERPITNITFRAEMFKPMLEGYEVEAIHY